MKDPYHPVVGVGFSCMKEEGVICKYGKWMKRSFLHRGMENFYI